MSPLFPVCGLVVDATGVVNPWDVGADSVCPWCFMGLLLISNSQKNVGCLYLLRAMNYNKFPINLPGKVQLNRSSHDVELSPALSAPWYWSFRGSFSFTGTTAPLCSSCWRKALQSITRALSASLVHRLVPQLEPSRALPWPHNAVTFVLAQPSMVQCYTTT